MELSFAAAVIIGLATRSTILKTLIDIDRRLKLQDRVSTAYEYLQLSKKSEFTGLLFNDAADTLRQISRQQLLPTRISWLHWLAIMLLATNILLYSGIFTGPDFKLSRAEQEKIDDAGQLLKDYMIKRIDSKSARPSSTRSDQAERLKQIGKKLNDRSTPFEQRLGAVNRFLQEVEGERTRLAQELATRLDSAAIEKLPIPQTPDLANLSSGQLEKLKGLLNRALNNQFADSIDQNIESLQQLDSLENLLSRIVDDLKAGRTELDDAVRTVGVEEGPPPPSAETPDNQPGTPGSQDATVKISGRNPNTGHRAAQRNFGDGQTAADGPPEGVEPSEGYSDAAGNAKSNQESQASRDLEKTQHPAARDKPAASPAKTYLVHIRALTDLGQARVKEAEILRTYRKEVESILQKEDIPVNYREYIKNYFISIGINTEENTHESK